MDSALFKKNMQERIFDFTANNLASKQNRKVLNRQKG